MTRKPKDNVNATEDFLDVVTTGYILTAVMSHLEMSSLDDTPSESVVSGEDWMEDDSVRCKILEDISSHIVNSHVDLATTFKQPKDRAGEGTVYDYACEALSLGLLIMDFKDAINPFESILHTFTTQSRRTTEVVSLRKLSWCSRT